MNKDNQLISERYKTILLKENTQESGLGLGENGLGEKPEKIKGEWRKLETKISEDKYYKTPIWYIANYSLNNYEDSKYYNNLNDAWESNCSSTHGWVENDHKHSNDDNYDLLKKIREAKDKPVPKWFQDLYWVRIDKRIADKYGEYEYDFLRRRTDILGEK